MFTVARMSRLSGLYFDRCLAEALAVCKNSKTDSVSHLLRGLLFVRERSVKVTRKALKQLTDLGMLSPKHNPGEARCHFT